MLNWDDMQIHACFILIVRKLYEFIVYCGTKKINSRPDILDKFSTIETSIQHKENLKYHNAKEYF